MTFVEDNRMIEQFPATVADPSFSDAILPRTANACALGLDAETPYSVGHSSLKFEPRSRIRHFGAES
jgi:hypothetical protein